MSLDRVEKFKKDRGIMFHFETSAKTGENIENLFIFASKVLYNSFKDKIEQMVSNLFSFCTHHQNVLYATLSILTKRLFIQKAEQLQKKGGKKGGKKLTRKDVAASSES